MLSTALNFLCDRYVFIAVQFFLVVLLIFSVVFNFAAKSRKNGVRASVIRGENSFLKFQFTWGVLSFAFIEWINLSSAFIGFKLFFGTIDVLILMYLCFYNGWFQNKVIILFDKSSKCDL